jgi:hypothetical protein
MNKMIAIYGAQATMGLVAVAAGYAKISGADVMVDAFAMLGLGSTFRLVAGCVEIFAGLCLMLPRAGVFGAALLACVVVGSIGLTIGQVASQVLPGSGNSLGVHQAVQPGGFQLNRPMTFNAKDGINI